MRVIGNSRDWGWNDSAEVDGDIESNGRPISITGIDSFLVLAHGIDLDIGVAFADKGRALPGHNILDIFIVESPEIDNVATEKGLLGPADGVNVDTVVNASVHSFRINGSNNDVIELSSSTIPAGLEVFFCKGPQDYFIAVRVFC